MKDLQTAQQFLEVLATDYEGLATYLKNVADTLPDHKKITKRILAGLEYEQAKPNELYCYIGEHYGKSFCIRYQIHKYEYGELRTSYEVEKYDLILNPYNNPTDLTVDELKELLRNRASHLVEFAGTLRADSKTLPEKYAEYEKAKEAYNKAIDSMSYTTREAVGIRQHTIY